MALDMLNRLMIVGVLCLVPGGCTAVGDALSGVQDSINFRSAMMQSNQKVREAEREARRREIEALRQEALREAQRNQVEMVPTLSRVLEATVMEKVADMRLVVDYKSMASSAAALAQLEEENERIYQEELAKWIKNEAAAQREQYQLASYSASHCPLHGRNSCSCKNKVERSGCAEPPRKRAPLKMPLKQRLPSLPMKYKLEFSVTNEVSRSALTDAQIGRAPLKERCKQENAECGCGRDGCSSCAPKAHALHRRSGAYSLPPVGPPAAPATTEPTDVHDPAPILEDETVQHPDRNGPTQRLSWRKGPTTVQ